MNDAVIVSAVRTAVGKAPGGTLRGTRPDELASTVIGEVLRRAPGIDPADIEDVVLGCAMPEAEQGLNVARIASLRAGVPVTAAAMTINRFCASGLQAIASAAERINAGSIAAAIAGGTESMSMIPMGGHHVAPNPSLVDHYPDVYLSTGLVAENHARESGITREAQDAFALRSHERAGGDSRRPVRRRDRPHHGEDGRGGRHRRRAIVCRRRRAACRQFARSAREAASRLPHHRVRHCRQLLANQRWRRRPCSSCRSIWPGNAASSRSGRFVAFATAGVEPERFGIGPVPAIRKVLRLTGLRLDQIDLVELNEAFAAQVLACLKVLPIDEARVNVNGGAIALGHPLGCTGAKLTTSLLYELKRRQGRYGLVSMCVGGGMGAAGIFERI